VSQQRNALGRGLGALLQPTPRGDDRQVEPEAKTDEKGGMREIPVDQIDPNPEQPRRFFDPEQLATLSDSIRRHGVLQPVVVCQRGDRYELQVGERRWRATQAAGFTSIPALIAEIAPRDRLEIALIENIQRHDLNPIELALSFKALIERGATQDDIGKRVGIDRSNVANHVRLLDLSKEHQEEVERGIFSMGHAKVLLSVTNPERRIYLRDRIVKEQLSVRRSEELARSFASVTKPAKKASTETTDPALHQLTDRLRDRFKTKVRIHGTQASGRIEISYSGGEDLRRVAMALLNGPKE
jgi:ParB family chromosome partitioning protein